MAGESQAVAGGELCCGWGSARLWAEVGWQGCQGVPGCQGVDFPLRRAGRGWGGLAGAGRGWGVKTPAPHCPPSDSPQKHCSFASLLQSFFSPTRRSPVGVGGFLGILGPPRNSRIPLEIRRPQRGFGVWD